MATVRVRAILAWAGIALFGIIATLALIHLAIDGTRVIRHVTSMAAFGTVAVAGVVIAAAGLWILLITWLAGQGRRGQIVAVVAGFAVLLALRIAIAVTYDGVIDGEARVYGKMASDLANGVCCLGAEPIDRPIGYPLLLAGTYLILGQTSVAVESLNILLALAAGALVFVLGRRLYGARAGAVALTLYALWPAGALMVDVRLPQTAHDTAVLAAAAVVVLARPGWLGSLIVGAVLGLADYLRPVTLAMLPAFLVARIWPGAPWRRAISGTALPMLLAFFVVLLPIVAWNLSTRGVPDISTSAYGGWSLYIGTDIENGGRFNQAAADELDQLSGSDRWQRSSIAFQRALERITGDPLGIALLALRKQYDLWGGETDGVRYGIRRDLADRPYRPNSVLPSMASGVFYTVAMLLTVLGLYVRRRHLDTLLVLLILTAATVALMHGLVEVRDRYHSYVIPMLMPVAAFAIVWLVRRLGAYRRVRSTAP